MPRSPYPPPKHSDGGGTVSSTPKTITFLHPDYERDAQPLLILPACDQNDTIDHELARIACAIVANDDKFEGYLTTDVQGQCRVSGSQLPFIEDGYFFQAPRRIDFKHPRPICPSFRHWSPPSTIAQLPTIWKDCIIPSGSNPSGRLTSVVAHNVIKRDATCRITNYTEQTEAAHIIPDGESEWFHSRGLIRRAKMDDESNFVLLKIDIHRLWDRRQFTIVPRSVGEGQEKVTHWVTYVLQRHPFQEVISLYHDVCLQPLSGVDVLFLFCRFAWTIFESLDIFLDQGSERWLLVRNPSSGVEEVAKFNAIKCRDKVFTKRGRSQSPKKNKRVASDAGDEDDRSVYSRASSSSAKSGHSDREIKRGRKRSRSYSISSSRYTLKSFVSSTTPLHLLKDDNLLGEKETPAGTAQPKI